MVVILILSSGSFSSARTGNTLSVVLAWTAPWLTPGDVAFLHPIVRKLAHLTVYAILALLWFRAFLRDTALTRGRAGACAFAISVAWAGVDELSQHFEPSRAGALGDVAIDALGSAVALGVAHWSWVRAVQLLGLSLLWVAALGGAAVIAVNLASGVPSGILWLTAPAAALILAARRWRTVRP
jgi:VanZ family protein